MMNRLMTPTSRLAGFALAMCAATLCGCGGGATAPGTVRAGGKVTMQGAAVAGASVTFFPLGEASTLASQAMTDNEGVFQLSTHVGGGKFQPGIAPGNYAVTVSKLDVAAIKDTLTPPKNLLPGRYADAKTSKLSAYVTPSGENNFELKLDAN
jgi:hypothetical protein